MQPKVSIVMPFYNRIKLTHAAIKSARKQTYENIELILVDDGSTEDISKVLQECEKDPRIIYLKQSNAGPARARNLGIARATGQYIAFLDSDDLFSPNKIETQLKYMIENHSQFCHTAYYAVNEHTGEQKTMSSGLFFGYVYPRIILNCPIATPTVMGKAELFKRNPFPEQFRIGEDTCLWIQLSRLTSFSSLNTPLTTVRTADHSSAIDIEKHKLGLNNIANFITFHNFDKATTYADKLRSVANDLGKSQ